MPRLALYACGTIAAASLIPAVPASQAPDVAAAVARVGHRVEEYYAHARNLICTETVRVQPMTSTFSFDGPGRELVYESRLEWQPPGDGDSAGEATLSRELQKVNGRTPRVKDRPGCTDPKPMSPEPLAFLLPSHRDEWAFTWAGETRVDGRPSIMLDYKGVVRKPPKVDWSDDCVSIDLPGRWRGRIWVDAETDDILRYDEHLIGQFETQPPRDGRWRGGASWIVLERADTSIRYRPMIFHDPDEMIVLPTSVDTMTSWRGAEPRLRTTQTFSSCKRFLTHGRVVRD